MKSYKSQIPNPKQIPSTKVRREFIASASFGAWNLGFFWDLGFGIWDFFHRPAPPRPRLALRGAESGSTFIIVLWIAFGLVSMALYFAHSMSFELRATDNRVSCLFPEHAI